MMKRNVVWLVVIIAVGLLGWLAFGIIVGMLAAVATLILSEVIERRGKSKAARQLATPPEAFHRPGRSDPASSLTHEEAAHDS